MSYFSILIITRRVIFFIMNEYVLIRIELLIKPFLGTFMPTKIILKIHFICALTGSYNRYADYLAYGVAG